MDNRLLALLVCPVCKGPLTYDRENNELISAAEGLAFPIRDGIPVLLESEARSLDAPGGATGGPGGLEITARPPGSLDVGGVGGVGRPLAAGTGQDASNDPA